MICANNTTYSRHHNPGSSDVPRKPSTSMRHRQSPADGHGNDTVRKGVGGLVHGAHGSHARDDEQILRPKNGHHECDQCAVRQYALCSVFKSQEGFARFESLVRHKHLHAGQSVFEEGDPSEYVYNVSEGAIRLYKLLPDGRRQITGFLLPGAFLGLALRETYSYGAEAVTDSHLCQFRTSELKQLFLDFPELRQRLYEMANDELAAAQEQMLLLGRKTAQEKIASFLLQLADHALNQNRDPLPLPVPMTREDIADYLGLTVETVSRVFSRLRKSGVLTFSGPSLITEADFDALEDLAEEG